MFFFYNFLLKSHIYIFLLFFFNKTVLSYKYKFLIFFFFNFVIVLLWCVVLCMIYFSSSYYKVYLCVGNSDDKTYYNKSNHDHQYVAESYIF